MKGIGQPEQINQELVKKIKARTSGSREVSYYVDGILSGNRTILSQAITLVESSRADHKRQAMEIISACLKHFCEGRRAQSTGHRGQGTGQRAKGTGRRAQGAGRRRNIFYVFFDRRSFFKGGHPLSIVHPYRHYGSSRGWKEYLH